MKKKLAVIAAVVALVALAAAPASAQRPAWSQKSDESIVSTVLSSGPVGELDAEGGDFDVLREALVVTGLVAAFDGSTDYTVFAPTDQAFYDLTGTTNDADALAEVLTIVGGDLDALANILLYHVTEGVRPSPSVVNVPAIEMLNGDSMSPADELDPVSLDLRVQDGIIHVIGEVLLP